MCKLKIKHLTIGEGMPKIIVSIVGKTNDDILQEAKLVKSLNPDVVEWRADAYEQVEDIQAVKEMIVQLRKIFMEELFLFTFRSHKEGGNKEISDEYYFTLNKTAIMTKNLDLIDVELFNEEKILRDMVAIAKEYGVYVIMSNHDFGKTPAKEEIIARLRKMQEYGADIPKIAVMPVTVDDVITLLDATNTMKTKYANRPIITMSMGGTGLISRLAGEVFGSAFTFGAGREASAPGQIPVKDLRTVLHILHNSQ
nr:type I 3-dehydroquinate dehydratase [uncultured Bacillus sp.]